MRDTPFELTLAGFKASALQAIDEQRLAIQHEDRLAGYVTESGTLDCKNVYPPEMFGGKIVNCIIGCALPPALAELHPDSSIDDLEAQGLITISDGDLEVLSSLQTSHDDLIQSYGNFDEPTRWTSWRDSFIQAIRDFKLPAEAA